jgi:hypothetical protein
MMSAAAVALVLGAFALFQATLAGQPFARFGRGRVVARLAASGALVLAARTATRAMLLSETILFLTVALVLVATVFVPLVGVRPRWAWGAALASPVVWLLLSWAGR